jgi:hypothetical protein
MSVTAFATVVQDAFDKTYPRDNTFCQIGQKRIEIMIRGFQSHTEPKERMWGDNVFARGPEGKISRIPVTQEQSGIYRFFSGNPSSCTKGVGSMVGKRFAMLFQKHNSPSKHKVVIQYLDPVTLEPLETVYTPYLSDKARVTKTGLVLRTFPPARQEMQMGKVMIGGKNISIRITSCHSGFPSIRMGSQPSPQKLSQISLTVDFSGTSTSSSTRAAGMKVQNLSAEQSSTWPLITLQNQDVFF